MLAKSTKTYDCGDKLLTGNSYFDQSIHCFYYSIIQLMKYKLAHLSRGAISYDEQAERSKNSSSHQFLLEQILIHIANREKANYFRDVFKALKKFRTEADYGEKLMSKEDCLECKELNERAKNYLRYVS